MIPDMDVLAMTEPREDQSGAMLAVGAPRRDPRSSTGITFYYTSPKLPLARERSDWREIVLVRIPRLELV